MNKKQEQIKNLRSWIEPKEVQIHTLEQNIELEKLIIKHSNENVKDGWFIKQKRKKVKEARTELERKVAEFELETLESDLEKGFIGQLEVFKLEELESQLQIEEKTLKELKRKIILLERNYKEKKNV